MFRDTQLLSVSQSRCSAAGESTPCPLTFDWPFGPGKTLAIDGHHFTQGEVYPRRTPAATAGSARQSDTDNNNVSCRSPVRAIIAPLTITLCMVTGLNIPVRMTMMPGVLWTASTLSNLHNQLPYNRRNNVTRCHIQNEFYWPALFYLMNCRRLTVLSLAQYHVCQH